MFQPVNSVSGGRRRAVSLVIALLAGLALFGALAGSTSAAGLPVITGLSPAAGPTAGGNSVIITGSNLTGANMSSSNLQSARLTNTNMTNAIINDANLQGASMKGATVNGLKFNEGTTWPDGKKGSQGNPVSYTL